MDIKKNNIVRSNWFYRQIFFAVVKKNKERFNLIGVSAHNNAELLSKIVNEFDVPNVVLSDPKNAKSYYGKNELYVGQSSLIELAKINCDIVISGIIGMSVCTQHLLQSVLETILL